MKHLDYKKTFTVRLEEEEANKLDILKAMFNKKSDVLIIRGIISNYKGLYERASNAEREVEKLNYDIQRMKGEVNALFSALGDLQKYTND